MPEGTDPQAVTLESLLGVVSSLQSQLDALKQTTPPDPKEGDPQSPPPPDPKKTQEQHPDLKKAQTETSQKVAAVATRLKEMQDQINMSEEQKKRLQSEIDELRTLGMTEKQKLEVQLDNAQKALADQTQALQADAAQWRARFENQQVQTEVERAVSSHGGKNSTQFLALFNHFGTSVKEIDGTYQTRIKFTDKNKDGAPVLVELSPMDTVARMAELPDYENLFNPKQKPGTGLSTVPGQSATADFSNMSVEDYAKLRPSLLAKRP